MPSIYGYDNGIEKEGRKKEIYDAQDRGFTG
jgi:hypothetical protein